MFRVVVSNLSEKPYVFPRYRFRCFHCPGILTSVNGNPFFCPFCSNTVADMDLFVNSRYSKLSWHMNRKKHP